MCVLEFLPRSFRQRVGELSLHLIPGIGADLDGVSKVFESLLVRG